ncbi:MAG: SlyX family protein [Pseudohongiellaceae bacterium]
MTEDSQTMTVNALRADVVDLQSRLQFQDDFIHKLDTVIIQQGRQVEKLQRRLELLEDHLAQIVYERSHPAGSNDEKPPHY